MRVSLSDSSARSAQADNTPYDEGQAGFIADANLSADDFLFCRPGKKRRDRNLFGGIDQHPDMGRHREKVL